MNEAGRALFLLTILVLSAGGITLGVILYAKFFVNVFSVGRFEIDINRVLLDQFGDLRKMPENATFSGHKTLKMPEKPAVSLLPRC